MVTRSVLIERSSTRIDFIRYFASGDYSNAYIQAVKFNEIFPDHQFGLKAIGTSLVALGKFDTAIDFLRRAVEVSDNDHEVHNSLGSALRASGDLVGALSAFDRVLDLAPEFLPAHVNRGRVLVELGRSSEALECYLSVLRVAPKDAVVLSRTVDIYKTADGIQAAIDFVTSLIQKDPWNEVLYVSRALLHYQSLDYKLAVVDLNTAIALGASDSDVYYRLGNAYQQLSCFDRAEQAFKHSLTVAPTNSEAVFGLGVASMKLGKYAEARSFFSEYLKERPNDLTAVWISTMLVLNPLSSCDRSRRIEREEFKQRIQKLALMARTASPTDGFKLVGLIQPFYLAYHEENNKEVLQCYGAMCADLMERWRRSEGITRTIGELGTVRQPHSRVKLGIVCGYIRAHSVWEAIVRGILDKFDKSRFDIVIFHTGSIEDTETKFAIKRASAYFSGQSTLQGWVSTIIEEAAEILFFPEIGMDPMTLQLASLKLAPIQIASWGHPQTTGLPTIDYFVSAEAFEPSNADAYYSERLVKLPNLGSCYYKRKIQPVKLSKDLLPNGSDLCLVICPSVLFKYTPQFDHVFVDIVLKHTNTRFILFSRPADIEQQNVFVTRLRRLFSEHGLSVEHFVKWIPWQSASEFSEILKRSDIYFDTLGFSGFNTAMQAALSGLPIVAYNGKFMRGRFASGILSTMGLGELVAHDSAGFVNIASLLIGDTKYRHSIRELTLERSKKLLHDEAPIQYLQDFIVSLTTPNC